VCTVGSRKRSIPLGFTEERIYEGTHICLLFNDERERLQVVARYLESGMSEGEKILYLADSMTPNEMLDRLEALGVKARSKSGFQMGDAVTTYCAGGSFSSEDMLAAVRDFYLGALKEGNPGARGTGEMSWCLVKGRVELSALMDYEARLTLLLEEFPYTACCQYDTRRFDGNTIMDVLSVHPMTIVRGQLVKNPFFVDPRRFLETQSRPQQSGDRTESPNRLALP
jgi:hypothetical protein